MNDTTSQTDDAMGVDTSSISYVPTSGKAMDPELQPYVERVLAMDPYKDVPSPVVTQPGKLSAPTVDALPSEDRAAILTKLQGVPAEHRRAREAELVTAAVREKVRKTRFLTGLGEGALPYHQEQVSIQRQLYDMEKQRAFFRSELEAIRHYETEADPLTGERKAKPVPRIDGPRRKAYEDNIRELDRKMRLLEQSDGSDGLEAAKRIREALIQSAELLYRRDQEAAELAEVKRRAKELNREARINTRAKALASFSSTELR